MDEIEDLEYELELLELECEQAEYFLMRAQSKAHVRARIEAFLSA